MNKVVRKKIISSTVLVSEIVIEGNVPKIVELAPLVLNKKMVSLAHAEREVRKADQYKELRERNARLVVSGYENHEDTYVMDQIDFVKYATIEDGVEQTELELSTDEI